MLKKGVASRVSVATNNNETPLYQSFHQFFGNKLSQPIPIRRFIYILETFLLELNLKSEIKSEKRRDSRGTVFINIGLKKENRILFYNVENENGKNEKKEDNVKTEKKEDSETKVLAGDAY